MERHEQSECANPDAVEERRRHRRVDAVSLDCSHGIVLDLSRGGVRLVSRKPLEGRLELTLQRTGGAEVRVAAVVAWTKRVRFNEHLNGLEFVDAPPDLESRLAGEVEDDVAESQDGS